jgi:starch phosphorylase
VECVASKDRLNGEERIATYRFEALHPLEGEQVYGANIEPSVPGLQYYRLRVYPYHRLLSHPFETGYMLWL